MENTLFWQEQALPAKLFVVTNYGVQTYLFDKQLSLGRKNPRAQLDIELSNIFVSRQHGLFGIDTNGFYYEDVGSANGTYVNEQRIYANQRQYLKHGDILKIATTVINSMEDIVRIIFVTSYPNQYEWYSLGNLNQCSELSIGRGSGNSLGLSDQLLSVNHASFFISEGRWNVIDFNSTNGVYINGLRLTGQSVLSIGDCIAIADLNFIFTGNDFIYQSPMISSQNLASEGGDLTIHIAHKSVWQRARKLMLLQDINMTINNGELVLILGGSGAGKTTFMNAVMGYEKAAGEIIHGTRNIYRDFDEIKHTIGFVPQQDLLRSHDTVYNTLSNAAEMKLSSLVDVYEREKRIALVLEKLGLQRERDSLVSKLSGGQRKRLSIAVEYIADPSLFFLDEPDSGLDGIMAKALMENLRSIADENKIVMVISHSPDRVAHLFNKIIVLAKSAQDNCGHLAFYGSVEAGLQFFDTNSLEGIVQRINRPDEGGDGLSDYYIDKYKQVVQGDI